MNGDHRMVVLADRLMQLQEGQGVSLQGQPGLLEKLAGGGGGQAFAQPDLAARKTETTGKRTAGTPFHEEDLDSTLALPKDGSRDAETGPAGFAMLVVHSLKLASKRRTRLDRRW